jgi:hypothetical protein
MTYQAKLALTKRGDSWGEAGHRTHTQDSELVAIVHGDTVSFAVKQGAVNAPAGDPERSRPEQAAMVNLTLAHARTLAAFLASLPDEEA